MLSAPDAIILCGGAGLRLRSVTDAPKAMATIAGRPFLELLLHQLKRNGIERVILAVGYQGEVIRSYFGEETFGLRLGYSTELSPLGTGGALRQAADLINSELAFVMNGDSYTDLDIPRFVEYHLSSRADVSVLAAPADERRDCGTMTLEQGDRLAAFDEKKAASGSKYINAGMYLISREILRQIPPGTQISLEREVFPRWLAEGRYVRVHSDEARCIDIGTPERYSQAQTLLAGALASFDS